MVRRPAGVARTAAAVGLALAVGSAGTGASAAPRSPAPASPSPASLAALQHQLDAATATATTTANAVLRASAESASLRVNLDNLAAQQGQAQAALAATASKLYEQLPPQGTPDVASLVIDPGEMVGLRSVGAATALSAQTTLTQATTQMAKLTALTRSADALRHNLVARAVTVYEAQDRARQVIATLQAELLAQAAAAAKDQAAKAATAARLAQLAAARATLDRQSSALTLALSPTLSQAGKDALARQQPLLDTLVAAGSGYPAGYHGTGQGLVGVSSWYGPGFVGRDTASGTPYDPELLTCAMLAVPLGTVVRVTNLANNASVDVMVTDRGPYVGNRVIDLSHAAAVAVGNSGLATVRIEILAPN